MTSVNPRKTTISVVAFILPVIALVIFLMGAPTQTAYAHADCNANNGEMVSPGATQTCVFTCHGDETCHGTQSCQNDGTWSDCN